MFIFFFLFIIFSNFFKNLKVFYISEKKLLVYYIFKEKKEAFVKKNLEIIY